MELTAPAFLFLISGLLGAAIAGPISWDDSKCSTQCSSSPAKFNYTPGKTYVYAYSSQTKMGLTEDESDEVRHGTEIEVRAKVEIQVKGPCEMVLKLSDVSLSGTGQDFSFKNALEARPLPFAFDDGNIREVCPSPEDQKPFILNTKRAILSVLKNTMKDLEAPQETREIDIAGDCVTKYSSTKGWSSITITKTKDLTSCRQRQSGPAALFGKPYIVEHSTIQNTPLLLGKLECQQVVSNGLVKNVECSERNVFSPLSRSGKGAVVHTTAKMIYKEEKDGISSQKVTIGKRTNLLFSSAKLSSSSSEPRDGSEVRRILQELCSSSREGIRPEAPRHLAKMVALLRPLPYDILARIYEEIENKQLCQSEIVRDIYVDALSIAGTEGPVKLMVKLTREDKLASARQLSWITSMAFNTHVDEGVIREVLPLLKDYIIGGRQGLLSLSSMIHSFCVDNATSEDSEGDCKDLPVIKEVIQALKSQLGKQCKSNDREEEHRIRETLAAFENIGQIGDAEDILVECFATKENPLEVRHAAISAFRNAPCEQKVTRKMESIFQNVNEDAAMRIYAYRGAMNCPDAELVKAVTDTLQKEQVQQVGAYVMSHLRNSKESSSPVKQELRRVLANVNINQKFPSDPRKYSHYFEMSAFSERLNAGAEFEANVIRSPNSFMPKSADISVNTYAMGHEINLFEVGAEMDGMTYLLEKYFGDEGYFSQLSLDQLMKKLGLKEDSDSENAINDTEEDEEDSKKRMTRETKSGSLARISLLHERMGITTPNDPKVSAYISLLGRKIAMLHGTDVKGLFELKEAFSIMEILTELAQKQKVERSVSFQLLDTDLTVPSFSGMTVHLKVNATAVVALQAEGKFDVRQLFTSEKSADIDGHFSPSGAVEVSALMSVDSGVHKTALKVVANMHTSQYLEGKLIIQNGRILNLKINMPKEKIELVTFKSDVYTLEADGRETPVVPPAHHTLDSCTDSLDKPLGIRLCTALKVPKPLYNKNGPLVPVSGPVQLEISLQKTDKSLHAYSLQIEVPAEHEYDKLTYKAEFDTPGSTIDRHLVLEIKVNRQSDEQTVNYRLSSPFKKLAGTASLVARPEEKRARLSLTVDERDSYSIQTELKSTRASGKLDLQPALEIHLPRGEPYIFKGTVSVSTGKKDQLTVDLTSNRPLNNPAYLKGTIVKEGELGRRNVDGRLKVSTDITLFSPFVEARLHGTLDKQSTVYSDDMTLTYKLPNKSQHNAKFIAKMQNLSTRHLTKYSTKSEITFSQLPEANALVSWDYQHKPKEHLENDFKISIGPHFQDDEGKFLHILQVSKMQGVEQNGRKGETENRLLLDLPFLLNEVDINMKTQWDIRDKPSFNFNGDIKYSEDKHVQAALNYSYISSKPIEMEIEAKFSSPNHEIIYQDRVKERSPNEYEGKTMLQWARGKRANLEYVYRIKTDSSKVHHEVDLQLSSPLSKMPVQHKALLRMTRDSFDIRSHTRVEGRPVYAIDAKLARLGDSKIEVQLLGVEGELEVHNDDKIKSAKIQIKDKNDAWNYVGSTEYKSDRSQNSVGIHASWNEKQDPSNQLSLVASITKPNPRVKVDVRGHYGKDANIKIQGDIDRYLVAGTHDLNVDINAPGMRPVSLIYHHEMEDKTARCRLQYLRNHVEQLEIRTHAKVLTGSSVDISAGVELKSPHARWNGKELSASYKHERRSENYAVTLRAQNSPAKPYSVVLDYTTEPQGSRKKITTKAMLNTPIPKYRSQEAVVVVDLSRSVMKVNADFSNAQNKIMRTELVLQGTLRKGSGNFKLIAPFKSFKSLKAGLELDNTDKYIAQSFLEINDDRMLEWDSLIEFKSRSSLESTASLRSAIGPKYDFKVHVVHENAKKSLEFDTKKEDEEVFATKWLWEKQGKNQNAQMILRNSDWTWTVEAKNQKTGGKNEIYSLSSRGIGKPIDVTLNWNEEGNQISPRLSVCPGLHGSDCLNIEGSYKEEYGSGKFLYDIQLKGSDRPGHEIELKYLFSFDDDTFQTEFLADLFGKELGYMAKVDAGDKKEASLTIKLPSRQMKAEMNWKEIQDAIKIEAGFLTDALRQPSKRLSIDITHKSTSQRSGLNTHSIIIITHPELESPIKADVLAGFHDGSSSVKRPMEVKAEIEYSSDPNKKLLGEIFIERANSEGKNTTLSLSLYTADRQALDVGFQSHLGYDDDRTTVGGKWKFSIPGKMWKGSDFVEFDWRNKDIHYFYRSPNRQYEAHSHWEHQPGKTFTLNTRHLEEGQETSAKLAVDIPKPCFELTTHKNSDSPSLRYHMCIDSKSNELLSFTAESYVDNEKQTDAKIVFDRRDQKSFSAHIHWRPETLGEILHNLMTLSDKLESSGGLEKTIKKWAESVSNAAEAIQGSVLSPVADYTAKEINEITHELSDDLRHVWIAVRRIYNNLPEMNEIISPLFKKLADKASDLKQLAEDLTPKAVEEFYENLVKIIKEQASRFCEYGSVCYNIRYAYERKGIEGIGEYVIGVFENMPDAYYKIMVATKDFILENVPVPDIDWRPLQKSLSKFIDWVHDRLEPLLSSESLQAVKDKLAEYAQMIKENAREGSQAVKEDIEKQLHKLAEVPEIKIAMNILEDIIEEIKKDLKKLNLRKSLEQLESFAREFLSPEALSNAVRVVTLDPDNGKLDVEFKLIKSPEEIKTLLLASNPFAEAGKSELENEDDDDDDDTSVVESMTYAQAALKQEWLPPFKAHAQLIGGQHYVTYDSTFYDFAGECSYLLTRDFADGNFSVVVKYEGQGNKGTGSIDKSIIVVAGNKIIEIDADQETVQVDGQEVEMPFTYGPVTVVRRGSTVVIDYKKGLSVTCHLLHDYCTTAISGWYYGKTAGLFGTYDHEPANDFLRPKGQQAPNAANFARSWEVSSGCRFRNLAQEVDVDPKDARYDICRKAFKDSNSPLRACFKELKEEEYLKMCMRQVAIQRSASEAMCTVAAAFAHICRQKHLHVSLPSQCLKCQSKSGDSIEYGSRRRLLPDQTPRSADVVFVVEESQCNRAVVKELDSIARMIDRSLLDSGLSQNRFGLVAFGGRGREAPAHSHTARGKIFFDQKDLVLATEKMTFRKDRDQQETDTFQALTEAIRYPFRLGVSKNLILLTCSRCNEDAMSVSYPDIQNMLLQRGIVLHTLSARSINVRKSSTKGKTIYGMDAHKVYTSKDRSLKGDTDLRAQVLYPKDVCLALPQEVEGSFFTTQPITEGSPNDAKNWKSQLGKRVAVSAQPHPCQQCECSAADDDVAQPLCAPCRTPKPSRPVSVDTSDEDDEY